MPSNDDLELYKEALDELENEIKNLSSLINELETKLKEACSQMENITNDV